jgi:hypothetical protein
VYTALRRIVPILLLVVLGAGRPLDEGTRIQEGRRERHPRRSISGCSIWSRLVSENFVIFF